MVGSIYSRSVCAAAVIAAVASSSAHAAAYGLKASDGGGTSSFNAVGNFALQSDLVTPAAKPGTNAADTYQTNARQLRSPESTVAAYTFGVNAAPADQGAAGLAINAGGSFLINTDVGNVGLNAPNTAQQNVTFTINNLSLGGGAISLAPKTGANSTNGTATVVGTTKIIRAIINGTGTTLSGTTTLTTTGVTNTSGFTVGHVLALDTAISGTGGLLVANNDSNAQASKFIQLTKANTFSGGVQIGGVVTAASNGVTLQVVPGALGTGNVTVALDATTGGKQAEILTLGTILGGTSPTAADGTDYVNDLATLTFASGQGNRINLNFAGTDVIRGLIVDGTAFGAGVYGSAAAAAADLTGSTVAVSGFAGTGTFTVAVPEPTSLAVIGLAALALKRRRTIA